MDESHMTEEEQQLAAERLEKWRADPANWVEEGSTKSPPTKKRKRELKGEKEESEEPPVSKYEQIGIDIALYESKVDDLKTFMRRRLPPDVIKVQEYFKTFDETSYSEQARLTNSTLATVLRFMGPDFVWSRLLATCGIKEEDFYDRTVTSEDMPHLATEEGRKAQLAKEIGYFHRQIQTLVELAGKLPKHYLSLP